MNISAIQTPSSPQVSWSTINAQDKEADFLSLRLLNKRTRIRISAQPLDLNVLDGKGNYFVVSNVKGWFAAIARGVQEEYGLAFSPLSDLRESIVSSRIEGEDDLPPKRLLPVAGAPTHLALALNDERLAVGLADGSISIFDTSSLFSQGEGNIAALRTFPPGPPGPLRQILGNPADLPELVAVRREAESGSDGLAVEILDVKQLQSVGGWRTGGTAESVPTSIVWSAKGKQLAVGLRNGDIVTYSPTDTNSVKLHVPKPPSVDNNSVITVLWLSNQAFYGIYAPPGNLSPETPQKHVLTLLDPKTNSATQTVLETPYYASPALRPPGAFTVVMRNWNPAKLLVFVGDSTSSDIGLVGSLAENDASETWCNLTLEEMSTPSVPLDKDTEDTVPLALDMDLTSGRSDQDNSSSPVLYLYASDGTLQAWSLSNEKGGPYPGMVVPSSASTSSTSQTIQATDKSPAAPSVFAQPPTTTPAFGSTGFGTATPKVGQAPTFGSTGFASPARDSPSQPEQPKTTFGQTSAPAFGSSAFGQQTSAPAFGQTSAFGQSASTSAFGQSPATGFGAFASSGPSKFGSSGFGFGNPSPPAASPSVGSANSPAADAASPEADMSEADEGEGDILGGLSLGETGETSKSQNGAVNSMFGSFAQSTAQERPTTSVFSSGTGTASSFGAFGNAQGSGFVKPASGFGAFLKPAEPLSAPKDASLDKEPKPSSAFGTSGFGSAKPPSAFGQPSFGQSSSFGASAGFGKPSAFGSASPAPPNVGSSTSGGFSAFAGASKGFSSFAQGGTSSFGQQAQTLQAKPSEAPSIAMATSSEGAGKDSSLFATSEQKSPSPFGTPQNASAAFGSAKPSPPPFSSGIQNSASSFSSSGTSSFGVSAQGSNVFGNSQTSSPNTQKQTSSTFSTPTARGQSPVSSPEGSPSLGRKPLPDTLSADYSTDVAENSALSPPPSAQSTTPFGTPAPSAFKTTTTAPSSGAFGNLTVTPSAFKPSEGFGAFGASVKVPSTSPFANPKPVAANAFSTPVKPVSVFGAGGSGPASAFQTPTAGSTTPKFGTPSTPGGASVFGKSAFGTPATPSPASTTPLTTPSGNAFSAYSESGGFSAFAKAGKPSSFSDMLKSQKDEDASPSASSKKTPVSSKEKEKDELSFVTIPKPDELDQDNLPPTPSTHGTFDEEDQNLDDEQDEEHDDADSFLSDSFSEGSDGVPEEDQEESEVEEDDDSGSEAVEEQVPMVEAPSRLKTQSPAAIPLPDSRDSTPKSTPSFENEKPEPQSGLSSKSEKSASEQTKPPPVFLKPSAAASTKALSPVPIVAQLPDDDDAVTKRSTAPKSPPPLFAKSGVSGIPTLFGKPITPAEKPSVDTAKSASPPPSLFGKQAGPSNNSVAKPPSQSVFSKPASFVRSGSTTPPDSSSKPEDEGPLLAPKPVAPVISSSASLGLGRPGSRPARSSPLAGTPVSGDESKVPPSNQTSQSVPLIPKPRPASPRMPFGRTSDAAAQQKPMLPSLPKHDERQPQTASPVFAGFSATSPKAAQLGASPQGPCTPPSTFKPPTLGATQSSFPTAGNAPFIMPSSAPAGLSDKPGVSTASTTGFKAPGVSPQQVARPVAQQLPVQTPFESGMQRECQNLYMSMADELEQLAKTSQGAIAMRTMLGRPSTSAHSRQDLRDKTKWSFGDLEAFGKLIKGLEKDVLAAYEMKDELAPLMREVESNLLKAETRKEEIVRFSKAKADPDFARMLKARTIGPDAAETQSQLRKQIRLINDRVEQLEAHLKSCKKRLEEHRKGKSSIKPPSLDTINRTYRNIDLAIESQTQQIETLTSRIAKLDVDALDIVLHGSVSSRRRSARKGGSFSSSNSVHGDDREAVFRPQVTPSIAASTAAALNAERSALRLKNALSSARKTPLLNTQAAEPARRVPTLDNLSRGGGSGLSNSETGSALPSDFDSSVDYLREQDAAGESQRRPTRHAAHAKSVKLGKTHAQVPSSIATFDWGPLPKAKPMTTLPSDIRPETIARKASS